MCGACLEIIASQPIEPLIPALVAAASSAATSSHEPASWCCRAHESFAGAQVVFLSNMSNCQLASGDKLCPLEGKLVGRIYPIGLTLLLHAPFGMLLTSACGIIDDIDTKMLAIRAHPQPNSSTTESRVIQKVGRRRAEAH